MHVTQSACSTSCAGAFVFAEGTDAESESTRDPSAKLATRVEATVAAFAIVGAGSSKEACVATASARRRRGTRGRGR